MKNDAGLVYSPKAHYAIAFLSRGQDDIPEVVDRMSRVSRWVYDALSGIESWVLKDDSLRSHTAHHRSVAIDGDIAAGNRRSR